MADVEAIPFIDPRTPFYDQMSAAWPDHATIREYEAAAHRRELEAAAQPPVINVTVTGLPGHYAADTGTGEIAYVPGAAPGPCV